MKQAHRITAAQHAGAYRLSITFGDGHVALFDFSDFLADPRRTVSQKRYRALSAFKRFKLHYDIAVMWGDTTIATTGEDLRKGLITGVRAMPKARAAA